MHRYRSHTCGALRDSDIDQTVRLSGWCHRIRDHGGVLFVDLRDHYGLVQIVADSDSEALKTLESIRAESVVTIDGVVEARSAEAKNPNLATGSINGPTRSAVIDVNGQLMNAAAFQKQIVAWRNGAAVRLGDVAKVTDST